MITISLELTMQLIFQVQRIILWKNRNKLNIHKYLSSYIAGITRNVVKEYLEENQVTLEEVIDNNIEVVANETGLKTKNIKELLEINNNIEKVIEAINYAKEHKPKNLMAYTKHILKNGFSNNVNNVMPNSNFANFTQRKYDYDKLELQLLGWADSDDDYYYE